MPSEMPDSDVIELLYWILEAPVDPFKPEVSDSLWTAE